MTLLTENPSLPGSVGVEGGDCGERFAALDIPDFDEARLLLPMQWSEFCYACERLCTFATFAVCVEGLKVECTGCGMPRISPFTRMNSEAA